MAKYRVPTLHSFCWQEPVKSKKLTEAPTDAVKSDRYIVPLEGIAPEDPWLEHEGSVAWFDGTNWRFDVPTIGWHIYVEEEKLVYLFNGSEWNISDESGIPSITLFVDKNKVIPSPNGSFSFPYPTIKDAINHIISAGDNSYYKGYVINIAPGKYVEDIVLDDILLVNVLFNGISSSNVFLQAKATTTSLQCISNNDAFTSLVCQGLTFLDDVELRGASDGTLFGSGSLEIKHCQFSDSNLILQNVNNPILEDTGIGGNLLWSNVNNGVISGKQTINGFIIETDPEAFKPSGWLGDDYGSVVQNIGSRIDDLQFNLLNGGKSYIIMRSGAYATSTSGNIPTDVTMVLYNSTLNGDWIIDGTLELNSGSYVTGQLIENSGSILNVIGQKSSQISIGVVPDGNQYTDGIIPLPPDKKVSWALDEFNEIIKYMAPAEPNSLTNVDLSCNVTLYSGKLPNGLSNRWYQDGKVAGNTVDVIIQNNMILKSGEGDPDNYEEPQTVPFVPLTTNSARFRQGNVGTLKVRHNDGGTGLDVIGTLDIDANFIENPPGSFPRYPDVQDISEWDNQGNGDMCTDGIIYLANNKGNLQVTDVRSFNNFCLWEKMNAQINIINIDEGFNSFTLLHDGIYPSAEESNEFKLFYDNDQSSLTFSVSPTVTEDQLSSSKYISGIRYYGIGDTFRINYVGNNVYKKVYHPSHVSRFSFEALSSVQTRNPTSIPNVNDVIVVNEIITINRSSYYDLDTRMTAYLDHPWKVTESEMSPSQQRYVCTYGEISTDTKEYFLDEVYRLQDGEYDTIPSTITGQWNSQTKLDNGKALVYNRGIQYPNHNTSLSFPAGNPNYSIGFTGDQVYLRAFRDNSNPHSSMILTLPGLSISTVSPVGTGDVNVQVKLPTQTGWLDAGVSFNAASFTGSDGDGCRASVSDVNWDLTFGTFSTANSGKLVIVRITFRNANRKIESTMQVNW